MDDDHLLTIIDAARTVSLSVASLQRRVAAGQFPQPIPLGGNRVAFSSRELQEYIAERRRAREAQEGKAARRAKAIDAASRRWRANAS